MRIGGRGASLKVVFVYPRFEKFLESVPELNRELVDHYLGQYTTPPSLGIPILAALTPPEWEVELVDDNNGDPINFEVRADLVAINCFTPQATRAMELADGYRAAGRRVAMGGFWPSTMPEEALLHCDAVNVGDGEPTWPRILADAAAGTLARRYVGGARADLAALPIPRRDLFYGKRGYDWNEDLVQVARGCTYTCSMCAIPSHAGHKIRLRPVEAIAAEMRTLKFDNVYLADDLLFFPSKRLEAWSRDLFEALAPLGKKFFVTSTMGLRTDDDTLARIARAGVTSFYCTMNVDPKSVRALGGDPDARAELVDLVAKLDALGIRFYASIGLGRDWDGPGLADSILDLCDRARIRTAEFFLFCPYPGSTLWSRLERQGRILSREWRRYNGAHVVARPEKLEPDALYAMFVRLWREFYAAQRSDDVIAALEPDRTDDHMAKRRQRAGEGGRG